MMFHSIMKEYMNQLFYPANDCKFCKKPMSSGSTRELKKVRLDKKNKQVLRVKEGIESLKYICNTCREQLVIPSDPTCYYCHKPVDDDKVTICLDCSSQENPIHNRSAVIYNDFMREELALYKYRGKESLGEIFSLLLTIAYRGYYLEEKIDYLTFIPLHYTRLEERGFNQAEQFANLLYKYIGIPVIDTLIRIKETDKQSKIHKMDRMRQLKGSFKVNEDVILAIANKNILIIDDIYTTGSTLSEAIKVLKENGAKSIQGLTLARAK